MLYICLNADGTSVVSEQNPISTKHSSIGEDVTIPIYIFNDSKRANVGGGDLNPPPLIYTNVQVSVVGVGYTLQNSITSSISDTTLTFDSTSGWNIGTVIKGTTERIRIEQILSNTTCLVTRNYTSDGKSSVLSSHSSGELFTSETGSISLALPNPNDVSGNTAGTFMPSGSPITTGVDPSILTVAVDSLDTSNVISSNNALKYSINSLIKIDNEVMKVVGISSNNIQVIRGFNGTTRSVHSQNSIIYCVGIVDKTPITHKIFIKNTPPAGLPTQKKKDVKIVITADEEPQ